MGIYANIIVTTEGERLQTRATTGMTKINFTKIALGSGIEILNKESTKLTKQEQESAFDSMTISEDGKSVILEATMNNIGIVRAYDVREVGIFAKDDAGTECLYAVINTNIYDYYDHMQEYEGEADYEEITYRVNLKMNDAEQVTIKINKDKTEVVNNQITTQPGKALDARQANPDIVDTLACKIVTALKATEKANKEIGEVQHDLTEIIFQMSVREMTDNSLFRNVIVDNIDSKSAVNLVSGSYATRKVYI